MAKIRYSWYNSLRNEGHFMTKLSQEQLNNLSKEELVAETLMLQDQYIDLSQKVDFLTEQIILMNQRQFGRKTEKNSVPDGYQVYHSIDKERQDLTVAGCWVHSKRKFSEINKAFGHGSKRETMSHEAEDRISKMFAIDKSFDGLSIKEREKRRQSELKPLVDDFFTWAKASAVIYSLVETAKANNLRTYEYLELLLTEIPNHLDDKNFDYFENLMPWSDYVKERCHTLKKS